ncbi:MAG: hypothetical protein ABGX07_04155 [Pirellulaceae bacterium]
MHEKHALDDGLLAPQSAVVVKRSDAFFSRDVFRASFRHDSRDELNDRSLDLAVVP